MFVRQSLTNKISGKPFCKNKLEMPFYLLFFFFFKKKISLESQFRQTVFFGHKNFTFWCVSSVKLLVWQQIIPSLHHQKFYVMLIQREYPSSYVINNPVHPNKQILARNSTTRNNLPMVSFDTWQVQNLEENNISWLYINENKNVQN